MNIVWWILLQISIVSIKLFAIFFCWNLAIVKLISIANPISGWQMAMIYATYFIVKFNIEFKVEKSKCQCKN